MGDWLWKGEAFGNWWYLAFKVNPDEPKLIGARRTGNGFTIPLKDENGALGVSTSFGSMLVVGVCSESDFIMAIEGAQLIDSGDSENLANILFQL